jgi:hypothetical protein
MNTRKFLAGTWTIWRTGGGIRLVLADLWAGVRWALKGWR